LLELRTSGKKTLPALADSKRRGTLEDPLAYGRWKTRRSKGQANSERFDSPYIARIRYHKTKERRLGTMLGKSRIYFSTSYPSTFSPVNLETD
jgi:hypothetical protein